MFEEEIRGSNERDNRKVVFMVAFIIVFGLLAGFLLTLNQNIDTGAATSAPELDQALAAGLRPFEERLKENPRDVEALVGMGTLYFQAGSVRESIKYFESARATEPKNVDALVGLAVSFRATGRQADVDLVLDSLRALEASETDVELKARAADAITEVEKQPAP